MNQILRCDWLPERLHLARSGLPAASRKKNFPESRIINPLLTTLAVRSQFHSLCAKGSEIRDTKTLNLWHNIVSLNVLGRSFAFLTLRDQLVAQQKHLLPVEEM